MTVFGALDLTTGRVQTLLTAQANGHRFQQFLEQLIQRWPGEHLVLVLDNVSYHKTTPIRAWLARYAGQITIFWLPTYSPHLNRIERVWRFIKGKLAGHRFWRDRTGLIHATNQLLHHVRAQYIDDQRPHLALDQNFRRSA